MKRFLPIIFLAPLLAFSQNKKAADSLANLLRTAKADTQQVNVLNQLAEQYLNAESGKGIAYAGKAIALSRQIKFKKGEGDGYFERGQILANILKLDSAKADFGRAIGIYRSINQLNELAQVYNEMGRMLRTQGKLADGITYFQQAADLFERINNLDGSSDCLTLLANNYNLLNLYDKALPMYQKSYELRLKIHANVKAAQSLAGIGLTYRNKQLKSNDDKNFKLAIRYMLRAREVFIKADHKLNIALIDKEIGITYLYQNDYKNALVYLLDAEDRYKKLDNKRELGSLYKGIGRSYLYLKQYPQAKTYLDKGLAAAIAEKYEQHIAESYEYLYQYYKAIGNPAMSLDYHEKWMDAQDSLTQRNNFDKLSELTTKYETEKKEQQINLLNKENTIQKLSIKSRNQTISIIIGLFVLTGIMAALFYIRRQAKQKALLHRQQLKQQDILTKAIVDAEENERKRIASDLHDGVGQLFSAVKMNLTGLFERVKMDREEDQFLAENTLALVDESCKEVRTISHQMMPNMLLRSGIASDLKSFIEKIDADSLQITLEATGFKNKLESNVETMLYRVIQETINNVIKHARATRLDIALIRNDDGISATIADNGVGFDTSHTDKITGIGLKNIATRIEYLKGTVTYKSVLGKGTTVSIVVPVS